MAGGEQARAQSRSASISRAAVVDEAGVLDQLKPALEAAGIEVVMAQSHGPAGSDNTDLLFRTLPEDAAAPLLSSDRTGIVALRFWPPVAGIGLVEILRRPDSTAAEIESALSLCRALGKDSIIVQPAEGLYVGRVSRRYLNEGMALLGDGVPAASVESEAISAGMRAGPLAMVDDSSLELFDRLLHRELHALELESARTAGPSGEGGVPSASDHAHDHGHSHDHNQEHSQEHNYGHSPEREHNHDHNHDHNRNRNQSHHDKRDKRDKRDDRAHAAPPADRHTHNVKSRLMPESAVHVMEKMAHGFRRLGRSAGAGFYTYEDDTARVLWSGLKTFERRSRQFPVEDIRDRMLFIQVLEALRCLEEGIVASASDADFASIRGWGFPAETGGAAAFVEWFGASAFIARTHELAERYGKRFSPPASLSPRES